MVHENKGGTTRRKGRPGGEAPEGHAQSTSRPAHGSGHSLKQEIAQAKVKALQHIEVSTPSSSSSSSSKTMKAQGKQQSQPKGGLAPPVTETPVGLATEQASTSASASASASAFDSAFAAASADTDMSLPIQEVTQPSSTSWADITAQEEEEERKSMDDEDAGIQTGDQQQAWARVLEMTDEDLRKDPANIDRSKVFTYHFDPSLVNTSSQETSFDKPAQLPAWVVREEFLNKLNACKFLILKAPTGSVKSTIFPALAAKVMPKEESCVLR